ncbi:hypothetical protein CDAR_276151 [Caerostris darwini]|uniref:Uncharacterized protein n=1 Tax=Caerostris darwini TaxID=1538125 RepID=A0AAV4QJ52_9ARAC|nr:hypothetical protein CDAR_276151 [Caerostris darwini]
MCHDILKSHISRRKLPYGAHNHPWPPVVKCRSRSGVSSNVLRSRQETEHPLEKMSPTGLSFREVLTSTGSCEKCCPLGLPAGKQCFRNYLYA